MTHGRRQVLQFAGAGTLAQMLPSTAARAQTADAVPPLSLEELVSLDLREDPTQRLRAQVMVDGRGPFEFIVDTGADTSVVSTELAAALGLQPAGFTRVNGIAGARVAPRAQVGELSVGGRRLHRAALPVLHRVHLGALGLIGLDCLRDQRVEIDFIKSRMSVRPSTREAVDPAAIVVYGKARFGKLILVDSSVRGEPIYVVLDTGAQDTVGNAALFRLLDRRKRELTPDPRFDVELTSATGQTVPGRLDRMAELTLGRVQIHGLPIVYSDMHTFKIYKLHDEPTIMLGMATLRSFQSVSIDFAKREVGFALPGGATYWSIAQVDGTKMEH